MSFYVTGIICILWVPIWLWVASDTPQNNRFISEEEKNYLIKKLSAENKQSDKRQEYTKYVEKIHGHRF